MIYVARIDDAFAGFNFNGQYFHGIRDPLFLSLSVTSIKHPARKILYFQLRRSIRPIHHRADDLSPPPRFSSKAFGPIIRREKLERRTWRISREARIENQSVGCMQEKGARIYIYIAENGYFSRGSAVIGKWRSAQFPNHRGLEEGVEGERGINWSIIKPWLLPWKIGGHGGQIRDRPSFLSLSPSADHRAV